MNPDPHQGLAQQPLNRFLADDAGRADAELNRVYGLLTAMLAKKPSALAALKTAQRAWIAFRDLSVKLAADLAGEGTLQRQVMAGTEAHLTRQRVTWLLLALGGRATIGTGKEKAAADAMLNQLWKAGEHMTETNEQRAWLKWRDAELAFWSAYVGPNTRDAVFTRLTWERCRDLSQ